MNTDVKEIPVELIRPFVHRDRAKEEFGHMADSMKDPTIGLIMPIKVRKLPKKDKDGFAYELIYGEGRTQAAKRNKEKTIPAVVYPHDTPQHVIVREFLSENLERTEIPWWQKGLIIRNRRNAGKSFPEIAKEFHVKERYAMKLYSVVQKAAPGLEAEVADMTVADAEAITSHKPEQQHVVVQFAKETGQAIKDVLKFTRQLPKKDRSDFSLVQLRKERATLEESVDRTNKTLVRMSAQKGNGPDNLVLLLADEEYRDTYPAQDVAILKFEAALSAL